MMCPRILWSFSLCSFRENTDDTAGNDGRGVVDFGNSYFVQASMNPVAKGSRSSPNVY